MEKQSMGDYTKKYFCDSMTCLRLCDVFPIHVK